MSYPIAIFGAGATKACGGPLTNEILHQAFEFEEIIEREDFLHTLDNFLIENFHIPRDRSVRKPGRYPPLPLLISLLDVAIDRKQTFSRHWDVDRLSGVRKALEYVIFAVLQHSLRNIGSNPYRALLEHFGPDPMVVSLNYDLIADNTLMSLSEDRGTVPDYGIDVATERYANQAKSGRLHKLHGSLNWLYCPACNRLDVGISRSGVSMSKVLESLYIEEESLESSYSCHGKECKDCRSHVRPVMITPTHLKDYRNPHISRVWYEAERVLRGADRAIIVGYSLPEDDVEVIYLLKRSLSHLAPDRISVVEKDRERKRKREHPVGARFCTVFGDGIDWHPEGFDAFCEGFSL